MRRAAFEALGWLFWFIVKRLLFLIGRVLGWMIFYKLLNLFVLFNFLPHCGEKYTH